MQLLVTSPPHCSPVWPQVCDGIEATHRIRALEAVAGRDRPALIFAVTAHATEEDRAVRDSRLSLNTAPQGDCKRV